MILRRANIVRRQFVGEKSLDEAQVQFVILSEPY